MTAQQRRSEIVRARRSQRKPAAQKPRADRSNNGRQMPPMVSRNGMTSSAWTKPRTKDRKRDARRRRVDVPLGVSNAELRLPGVVVPSISWRMLSFTFLVIFGMMLFWMLNSPMFTVSAERVIVNGIERINLNSLLAKSGILNLPVYLVDPQELSENLPKMIPALESAEVDVGLNGEIVINAVERVPVLTWDQPMINHVSWVDAEGRIFPAIGASDDLVYVLANAAPPPPPRMATAENQFNYYYAEEAVIPYILEDKGKEQLLEAELVENLLALAVYLPEGSVLVYDGTHGFGWEDADHGWMVYFGKHLEQPEMRVKIYEAIVAMFEDKQRQPILISVEYLHSPYYRMEP